MGDEGYDEGYEEGYDEGYYDEAYDEGYEEQAAVAQPVVARQDNRPAPPPRRSQPEKGYPFIALYDYTGSNSEELTFRVGDELMVISEAKEGWYNATFNGN
jgi:hypothetical protein